MNWRFRTGFGGCCVLQRRYETTPCDYWGPPVYRWRDASAADLGDYYREVKHV